MTEPTTIKEVFQLLEQCPVSRLNEAVEEIMEHIDELEEEDEEYYTGYMRLYYKCEQVDLIHLILSNIPIQYERLSVKTKDKMHLILKSHYFRNALS
jgi:hypothetical protein